MYEDIIEKTAQTLVRAGSTFSEDKKRAYTEAIKAEKSERAAWVLRSILENAEAAEENSSPLCDDTGIPHLFLELGESRSISGAELEAIKAGVKNGLRRLPGRPMALLGDERQRIDQSLGMSSEPGDVEAAPIIIKQVRGDIRRLHIIMQGGGPAIRGRTGRIFHRHSLDTVLDEIVQWSVEAVAKLGCSPCTLAVGIGRSQLEAAALMTEAQVFGTYDAQSEIEKEITRRVNESGTGALGLGGDISVLATFLGVGEQRASGVRIVSMRPCCCFEPRKASVEL